MKKFLAIVLAIMVLFSFAVPVSADEVDTDPLQHFFDSVPIVYKSSFLTDDGYSYKYVLMVRLKDGYRFYMFGKADDEALSDINYLKLSGSSTFFCNSSDSSINLSSGYLSFKHDTTFYTSNIYGVRSYLNLGINNSYGVSGIESFVDNVIYSDIPIKYNGLTIYEPSKNQNFSIKDFYSTKSEDGGDSGLDRDWALGQIISSAPLTPIPGDPTFNGFKNWLIENEKYKDLIKFGVSCNADNIADIVDLWTGHYSSLSDFTNALTSTFLNVNAISQVSNIWNWFAQQFELYKKSLITYKPFEFKDDIFDDTSDYDTDGNFISSDTAYLKLILGVLNTFRNDFISYFDGLYDYLSNISINIVNLINSFRIFDDINDNLLLIYNKISDVGKDINANFTQNMAAIGNAEANVVDTLLNIDFSKSDCDYNEQSLFDKLDYLFIPQEIPDNYKISSIISDKFAFVGQIRDINSLVFDLTVDDEAIGTSETSDNLNYLITSKHDVILSDASSDTGVSGGSHTYWDTSDSHTLLTNTSTRAPDFSISLKGFFGIENDESISIFNFKIFKEYKSYINVFLIALCYLAYLRRLFARMPEFLRTGVYKSGALSSDRGD